MASRKINLLITGVPGVGKTTLIQKLAEALRDLNPVGFYTAEIREKGIRQGFELIGLDGQRRLLSHVHIKSPFRVGKYGVDVKGFELFLDALSFSETSAGMILIDEIGKMECFSEKFKERVSGLLASRRPLAATIALRGSGFIQEVKSRQDVTLLEIIRANRDSLPSKILRELAINA